MTHPCELDNQHELERFMDEGGIDPDIELQRRDTKARCEKDTCGPVAAKRDEIKDKRTEDKDC